jgi:hypothetical protein
MFVSVAPRALVPVFDLRRSGLAPVQLPTGTQASLATPGTTPEFLGRKKNALARPQLLTLPAGSAWKTQCALMGTSHQFDRAYGAQLRGDNLAVQRDPNAVVKQRHADAFEKIFGPLTQDKNLTLQQIERARDATWSAWAQKQGPEFHQHQQALMALQMIGEGTSFRQHYELVVQQLLVCLLDRSLKDVELDIEHVAYFPAPPPSVVHMCLHIGQRRAQLEDATLKDSGYGHITTVDLHGTGTITHDELSALLGGFTGLKKIQLCGLQKIDSPPSPEPAPDGHAEPSPQERSCEPSDDWFRSKGPAYWCGVVRLKAWEDAGRKTPLAEVYLQEGKKLQNAWLREKEALSLDLSALPDFPGLPQSVVSLNMDLGGRKAMPVCTDVCENVTSLELEQAHGLACAQGLSTALENFPNLQVLRVHAATMTGALQLRARNLRVLDFADCTNLDTLDLRGNPLPHMPLLARGLPRECTVFFNDDIGPATCAALERTMSDGRYTGPRVIYIGENKIEVGDETTLWNKPTEVLAGELSVFDLVHLHEPKVLKVEDLLSDKQKIRLKGCARSQGAVFNRGVQQVLDWASSGSTTVSRQAFKEAATQLLLGYANPNVRRVEITVATDFQTVAAAAPHVNAMVLHLGARADLPEVCQTQKIAELHLNGAAGLQSAELLSAWVQKNFPHLRKLRIQACSKLTGMLRLAPGVRTLSVQGCGQLEGIHLEGETNLSPASYATLPSGYAVVVDSGQEKLLSGLQLKAWENFPIFETTVAPQTVYLR